MVNTANMPDGSFDRDTDYIITRITRDARDGYPVEPDRYRLAAARACPWANRTIITRRLLGLEDVISLGLAGPTHDEDSWTFDLDPGGVDPVLEISHLKEAYERRFPDYPKGITVPALVDVATGEVVTNDYRQITIDFSLEWADHHREGAPDLYPKRLRDQIDEMAAANYSAVNDGVYKAGFATHQRPYRRAFDALFERLDWLEEHLGTHRYLVGGTITEADIRLWPTLVRFDAVYHNHFKCNRNKLTEMPALWGYARDLFQTPGFGDTIDFAQIKDHYYLVHTGINPTGVVPQGPDPSGWLTPHHRQELGGNPFGDGTPPPPPPADERVPELQQI